MIWGVFRALFARGRKRASSCFARELEVNLERVFVMEQRQNVSLKLDLSETVMQAADADYTRVVQAYNDAFDQHQAFALVYKSDLSQRSREKAVILDAKHDMLLEKFSMLKPVLMAARNKMDRDGHV
ncbi:MAG: hypothetical protein V2A70_05635 [Candidatus Omnitrophota bacterium]